MLKARLKYGLLTCLIIILGLLSRKFTVFPLWLGDVLWATMIYFILRIFYPVSQFWNIAIASIGISFAIEFSQLYKAPWLDNIRHTFFGRMVLGETFLWGDLLSYTAGILLAILIDVLMKKGLALKA